MQYETLFDIDNALPSRWGGFVLGGIILALFLFAHFRPATLEAMTFDGPFLDRFRPFIWPRFLWPYFRFLLPMLPRSIVALAVILAPRWRWGVAIGIAILAMSGYYFIYSFNEILRLRNTEHPPVIEGAVSKLDRYTRKSGVAHEAFTVGSQHFDYGESDIGSPFPLMWTNRSIQNGQQVRITHVGSTIVRVERQLCLVYKRCEVSYFLGFRSESER